MVARAEQLYASGDFPVRTCVGCRERAAKSSLLRLVATEDGLIPDPQARLPGRGAYLHPSLECLKLAQRRRAFPRALRVTGPLGDDGLASYLSRAV
ncbi:MAG TPA: YlxR family protein [Trebonia sp.]|nr:YlxR family protein [Trebonia sp.]